MEAILFSDMGPKGRRMLRCNIVCSEFRGNDYAVPLLILQCTYA